MQLFYDDALTPETEVFDLTEDEAKHALRVLRLSVGDELTVANGRGLQAHCRIAETTKKMCRLTVIDRDLQQPVEPHVHIAVSPLKNMNRIEWFIEKAVELSASRISLVRFDRTEKKGVRADRLEKVAVAALKQSLNYDLPPIDLYDDYSDFLSSLTESHRYIAYCETDDTEQLLRQDLSADTVILIGPEGDFTPDEVRQAGVVGFRQVSLGKFRLRTETAALTALTLARYAAS